MNNTYEALKNTPSDINEHLETLKELSGECDHITEMGVRYVVSTWAFAEGLKRGTLISIDIKSPHEYTHQYTGGLEKVEALCKDKGIDFKFILGDTLLIHIDETDLLFIDTNHTYDHLKQELKRHGNKARKYLVFHDTESCPELNKAIDEFLEENRHWARHKVFTNNNGLTVLKRC